MPTPSLELAASSTDRATQAPSQDKRRSSGCEGEKEFAPSWSLVVGQGSCRTTIGTPRLGRVPLLCPFRAATIANSADHHRSLGLDPYGGRWSGIERAWIQCTLCHCCWVRRPPPSDMDRDLATDLRVISSTKNTSGTHAGRGGGG
jgi:hypothetical protein